MGRATDCCLPALQSYYSTKLFNDDFDQKIFNKFVTLTKTKFSLSQDLD